MSSSNDKRWRERNREYVKAYRREYRARTLGVSAPRSNKLWTAEEDRIALSPLLAMERALLTGRTVEAVRQRAVKLRQAGVPEVPETLFAPVRAEPVLCEVCGKEVVTNRSRARFCSKQCYGAGTTKRFPIPCPTCGGVFKPASKGGGRWTEYCSMKCAGEAKRQRRAKDCPVCGRRFLPYDPRTRTCSRSCGYHSRNA